MAAPKSHKAQKVGFPRRGDIYLVNFDPTIGHEIKKTRPALVIQNDIANQYSPITIVAAITSKFDDPPYPTDVVMQPKDSGLNQPSAVVLNQIRSIDKQRLVRRIGRVTPATLRQVDRAILVILGIFNTCA